MRNFQQKRGWKEIIESWPVVIFLGILLLFFAWGVVGFMGKMSATKDNKEIAENQLVELEAKHERLTAEIAKLETEGGVEENIREKFGYAKEGEGLIVVVEDKDTPAVEHKKPNWFSSLFKKLFK